jgi:hypothetical protein
METPDAMLLPFGCSWKRYGSKPADCWAVSERAAAQFDPSGYFAMTRRQLQITLGRLFAIASNQRLPTM